MPQVVKIKGKPYIYDYWFNPETGEFVKKYVGKGTEEQYKKYKEEVEKKKVRDYCQKCGKRRRETLSKFYDPDEFDLCTCKKPKIKGD